MISKMLLIAALILMIFWAIGFWIFHLDSIIHITFIFVVLFLTMSYSLVKSNYNKF